MSIKDLVKFSKQIKVAPRKSPIGKMTQEKKKRLKI